MPINQIQQEALAISGIGDSGFAAGVVGDAFNLTTIMSGAFIPTITLTRKPAGSAAAIASGAFSADLPGVYLATVTAAGITRNVTVCIWPASILSLPPVTSDGRRITRSSLSQVVGQSNFNVAAAEAALEVASPTPDRFGNVTAGAPVQWAAFA